MITMIIRCAFGIPSSINVSARFAHQRHESGLSALVLPEEPSRLEVKTVLFASGIAIAVNA